MADTLGNLLIVDDDEDVLQAARLLLKRHAAHVHTEKNPERIPTLLGKSDYDVILLDMNFTQDVTSGREGFLWLDRILETDPSAVVILITAFGDVETAVRAIKEGATDFVLKPWSNEKLLATVSAASRLRRSRVEADRLRERQRRLSADVDTKYRDFVGASRRMQRVFEAIEKVAATDANVLILGEHGTGKELVARALHRQSKRAEEVFVSVDVSAIPETLFESELFGHVKGAFTDARESRAGRFEVASGGTLFLDEIGNLPVALQAKLLTVIQRREAVRVGSNTSRSVDVRLISATNAPIHELARQGRFRQDLLYRINTVEIALPPLRDRGGDVRLLADHFLHRFARKYGKDLHSISPAAIAKMESYDWPGNVRELEHAVERAVIMTESAELEAGDFFFTGEDRSESGEAYSSSYDLRDVEEKAVRSALEKHEGNVTRAAAELGLSRPALYRRMERYGL